MLGVGHTVRRVVVARHQLAELAETVGDDVDHRAIGRERHVLREPGDAQSRLKPHRAGVGPLFAAQDLQQRRLAGAVSSDQRHALARLDLEQRIVEQRHVPEREGDMIEGSNAAC